MSKRTVDIPIEHSSFIERVKHNGRGVLSVFIRGKKYDFRAPIQVADQVTKIAADERSVGKWWNHSIKDNYPSPNEK